MTAPQRIQLRRTKGWRKPDNTVVVARPSKWGNPFAARPVPGWPRWGGPPPWQIVAGDGSVRDAPIPAYAVVGRAQATAHMKAAAMGMAVGMYELNLHQQRIHEPDEFDAWIAPLRGHDLGCWCPLDLPCHADVLLELANEARS
jgi:hypothetical protein